MAERFTTASSVKVPAPLTLPPFTDADVAAMLQAVGQPSVAALADAAVPANIRLPRDLNLPAEQIG